jgi:hypothetical protein
MSPDLEEIYRRFGGSHCWYLFLKFDGDYLPFWEAGIARRYSDWLRAGRSGNRIPVEARYFAHVQTGPGAHPASCSMGTGTFPGVKRPGRGADHPPPSSAEVKESVPLPPLGFRVCYGVPLPFHLPFYINHDYTSQCIIHNAIHNSYVLS